ncbi:glycosyltransferase family 4 protein [Humitalea sp. 24SJ18S-53]|uniref:glycosyltransferase family 4 protein n=1 Tax=Humitalea sp. 24SJ18S-53 TaxID=3422307 RepID=UPI003D6726A9
MSLDILLRHLSMVGALALLSALVVRMMIRFPVMDPVDHRKAHAVPTPRGGGVGIVVAFMVGMCGLYLSAQFARLADTQFLGVILAAFAIAVVSFIDDLKDLRFAVKLAAQTAAALVAIASGLVVDRLAIPWVGVFSLGPLGIVMTVFWIVGCTNAVNFMDGLDGLVGGTVLIVCAILAAVAADQGGWFIYAAALLLAAGIAGFLPFNLHPARIFMGDVGSQFLGFVLAVFAVASARFDAAQMSFLIVPMLMFGLLADAAFTLLRRAAMGERISAPHRSHLYQMAQRAGVPVRAVAAVHWGFALFHGALVVVFLALPGTLKPLIVVPALAVQMVWAGYVMLRMRRAGISFRA